MKSPPKFKAWEIQTLVYTDVLNINRKMCTKTMMLNSIYLAPVRLQTLCSSILHFDRDKEQKQNKQKVTCLSMI